MKTDLFFSGHRNDESTFTQTGGSSRYNDDDENRGSGKLLERSIAKAEPDPRARASCCAIERAFLVHSSPVVNHTELIIL